MAALVDRLEGEVSALRAKAAEVERRREAAQSELAAAEAALSGLLGRRELEEVVDERAIRTARAAVEAVRERAAGLTAAGAELERRIAAAEKGLAAAHRECLIRALERELEGVSAIIERVVAFERDGVGLREDLRARIQTIQDAAGEYYRRFGAAPGLFPDFGERIREALPSSAGSNLDSTATLILRAWREASPMAPVGASPEKPFRQLGCAPEITSKED